jgi:hypothetical protein
VSRNPQQSLQRLYGLLERGRQFGLERMQAACAEFGNPERSFRAIHVAGTNGKGSVCAFTASMLRAQGATVGLFTSPHLNRFAERIQLDGVPLSDEALARLIDEVMDRNLDLSFFEAAALIAFLAFREAKVDWGVLEVGLGGRLDATNVIPAPVIAAITRVSFDHMDMLGNSLSEIAREKAAIIKAGSKVVVGRLHPDAIVEVERRCAEVGAELLPLGDAEPYQGAQLAYPRIAMYGTNLAVATTIGCRRLFVSHHRLEPGGRCGHSRRCRVGLRCDPKQELEEHARPFGAQRGTPLLRGAPGEPGRGSGGDGEALSGPDLLGRGSCDRRGSRQGGAAGPGRRDRLLLPGGGGARGAAQSRN